MSNQNKNNTLPIILLVILGAIAVFALGIILGNLFGSAESTPPPVAMPTPAPGIPTGEATTHVNVRTGPSEQYPIYGIAQPGAKAEIVGVSENGEWWVVKLPTDLVDVGQGWVAAEYIKATDAENVPVVPAPPLDEIEIPPPGPDAPTAEALAAINVRSGPGTDYSSYGIAPEGMLLEVTGVSEDGGWWVVKIPTEYVSTGEGWVSDDYVETTNTGDVPVVPAP